MHYRLYFKDQKGGFREARDLFCETDDEAAGLAQGVDDPRGRELWQGRRLIRTIESAASAPRQIKRRPGGISASRHIIYPILHSMSASKRTV